MVIMLQFLHTGLQALEKLTRNINTPFDRFNRMLGTEDNPGNMFHTLKELFMKMKDYKMDREFKIRVSFLEIYNE
jgi:Kinesin motor domain